MKRTVKNSSLLTTTTIFYALAIMILILSGCGSQTASPQEVAADVVEPQAVAQEPTPTDEPSSTPVIIEETAEPLPADTCFDCHTDKDLLIDTADPEEEVINENEGEG